MFDQKTWKVIWRYLDLEDLMKFKRVSKDWYRKIDEFVIQRDWFIKYRRLVSKPPSFSIWEEIEYTTDFFLMYKTWRIWRKGVAKTFPRLLLDRSFALNSQSDESFSCIVTKGDIFGVGTKSGEMFFYRLSDRLVSEENFKAFFMPHTFIPLRKMRIWKTSERLQAIVQCDNDVIKVWDLNTKEQLKNEAISGSAIETSGALMYAAKCKDEDWFLDILHCQGEYYTRRRANIPYDGGIIPLDFRELYAEGRILTMVSVTEFTTDICIVSLTSDDGGIEISEIVQTPTLIDFADINNVFVFDSCIFATTPTSFCVSIDKKTWKVYLKVSEHLGANIKSVALHAEILILGLDNGQVHIFFLSSLCELNELNLSSKTKRVFSLCPEPINSIRFTKHEENRYILVMTVSKVFLFHL